MVHISSSREKDLKISRLFFLSEKQDVISIASAGTKKEEVHFLSKSYSRLSCVNTDGQFDFENAKIQLGPAPLLS